MFTINDFNQAENVGLIHFVVVCNVQSHIPCCYSRAMNRRVVGAL